MTETPTSGQKPSPVLCTTELRRNAHVLVLQEMRTRLTDAGSPSRTAALDAAISALSARPSPGGQDALAYEGHSWVSDYVLADLRERAALPLQLRNGEVWYWQGDGHDFPESLICPVIMSAETLRALLAARQPVGEPVGEVRTRVDGGFIAELLPGVADRVSNLAPLYTAPPAQQPAQVYLDGLDRALGEAIDQRDRYQEVADDLAGHIAAITGVDIGEHSSANCPWQNAIEAAEEYKPAQAVDLGAERMFYIQDTRQFVGNCPMWWGPNGSGYVTRIDEAGRYTEKEAVKQNRTRDTDIPWPCAEIDAIARPTVDCQHMRPRAERLAELALIDSQAVGNG